MAAHILGSPPRFSPFSEGTGCAGKFRMTTSKSCAAHGGTYNASAKTCSYTASTRSAKQICDQQGGYYDTIADTCEVGMD